MKIIEKQAHDIRDLLKLLNNTYQSFYNFEFKKVDDRLIIIDSFEEFYYGSQDFLNIIEDLENNLRKILNDENIYLDCDCPGRWIISN